MLLFREQVCHSAAMTAFFSESAVEKTAASTSCDAEKLSSTPYVYLLSETSSLHWESK